MPFMPLLEVVGRSGAALPAHIVTEVPKTKVGVRF
jgi:hypothetical protein